MNIFENYCLTTIGEDTQVKMVDRRTDIGIPNKIYLKTIVSIIGEDSHIKMIDRKTDTGIPNKIADDMKQKRSKWFGYVVRKDNAVYVNNLYKNDFTKKKKKKKKRKKRSSERPSKWLSDKFLY